MRIRLVSIASLFLIVLAACGGDSKDSSSTTTAPSTTATTSAAGATATSIRDAAANARAQKLVLTQPDFPPGWKGTPATPDTAADTADRAELNTCAGLSGDEANLAHVNGDDFSMGLPSTSVSSEAKIVDAASYAKNRVALKAPKVVPCIQTFFSKAIARQTGGQPSSVEATPIQVPSFGDVSSGLRLKAGATFQGTPIVIYVDVVNLMKDRAQITATFLNLGNPFDSALQTDLINKLGAKLNAS